MKVTLSAAMRARDVSRPSPDDEAAAEQAEARQAAGGSAPKSADGNAPLETNRENNARPRENSWNWSARPARKNAGSGGRSRRKRR